MIKKIFIIILVISLVFLSGCVQDIRDQYCKEHGYKYGVWEEELGDNYAFYCVKEIRSERISNCKFHQEVKTKTTQCDCCHNYRFSKEKITIDNDGKEQFFPYQN